MSVTPSAIPARPARAHEKYAWMILFGLGALLMLGAITHIAGMGLVEHAELMATSPALASVAQRVDRDAGLSLAGFALLVMVTAAIGFRRRERWAWYALWTVPAFLLGQAINNLAAGRTFLLVPSLIFIGLAALALLLPARQFFPGPRAQ